MRQNSVGRDGTILLHTLIIILLSAKHPMRNSEWNASRVAVLGIKPRARERSAEGVDDFAGGVGAAGAGKAVAGMGTGAAEKKATDGRFVSRPIENGTHREQLIESKLTVENVAPGEAIGCFEVLGSDDLDAFDEARQIRGVRGERPNDSGAEFPSTRVPIPFPEFIRSILNAGGENMLAFRSESGIENGWNGDVEIRRFRKLAVLGGVEGTLEVVDFRTDVDAARECFKKTLRGIEGGESGKTAERKINFRDSATRTEILDAIGEGGIEVRRIDKMEEGAFGVDAGDDGLDRDFFSASQNHAGDSAIFHADLLNLGVGANFRAGLLRRLGYGIGEVAEPATRKSSGADGMGIGSSAHQKDCGGTCRPGAEGSAENSARSDHGTNKLGIEKFGNEVRNGHGAPAEKIEDSFLAKHADVTASLKEIPEVFGSGLVNRWRGDRNKVVQDAGEMIESVREFNVFGGILGGKTRDAASSFGVIVPENKSIAVGRGGENPRAGIEDFATEFFDLHVARDLCAKRAEGMGER